MRRNAILFAAFAAIFPAARLHAQTTPLRIAVYDDKGSPRTPSDMEHVLHGDPRFTLTHLSAKDIRNGRLAGFDVLVQGGGNSIEQSKALKEQGRDAIRTFIHDGGGYLGICGGAHFSISGDKYKLDILNADVVDNEHWDRGAGTVTIAFTEAGRQELHETAPRTRLHYHQGPLLVLADRPELPPATIVATYETEIAKRGAPHGVMRGTGAAASAPYGKGRVFVFSPHPEQTAGQENMVKNALLWTAEHTPATPSTSNP